MECQLISPAVGYDKSLTPPPTDDDKVSIGVNMTLDIMDVINIDQVKGVFVTTVSVKTTWLDSGLTYNNLKTDAERNQLNDESEDIWSPFIVYTPVENAYKIEPMQDFLSWKVVATNVAEYKNADISSNKNIYKFSGKTNAQERTQQNSVEWICHFDLFWYPFDTQTCNLKFYIKQNYANLYPTKFTYSGPLELIAFNIKNYSICSTEVRGKLGVAASMEFGRPLTSNILTVFIPTLIILAISHVANRFDQNYVDMVIGVNLTVLLVLTSL